MPSDDPVAATAMIKNIHTAGGTPLSAEQSDQLEKFTREALRGDLVPIVKDIAENVLKMRAGENVYGSRTTRRVTLTAIGRDLRRALKKLNSIDPRTLTGWIEPETDIEQPPTSTVMTMFGESPVEGLLSVYAIQLAVAELADRVEHTAAKTSPRRVGKPSLDDPILFGVQCLAALHKHASGCAVTASYKRHGFGDTALRFFQIVLPDPDPSPSVREAVRRCVDEAKHGAAGPASKTR